MTDFYMMGTLVVKRLTKIYLLIFIYVKCYPVIIYLHNYWITFSIGSTADLKGRLEILFLLLSKFARSN